MRDPPRGGQQSRLKQNSLRRGREMVGTCNESSGTKR